ncbi:hypothetical protein [Sphingomonas molluscorum]|uniref:hypothetical protein n=1 Tax=Sphingomonas molluscorum TaxID=418184 RepID=UPI0031D8BA47
MKQAGAADRPHLYLGPNPVRASVCFHPGAKLLSERQSLLGDREGWRAKRIRVGNGQKTRFAEQEAHGPRSIKSLPVSTVSRSGEVGRNDG